MTFNREQFAEILSKIYHSYSNQREFAETVGVSRTYLSQYMNRKLLEPPKPKILKKIADNSTGFTTYSELMKICGYLNEEKSKVEETAIQSVKEWIEQKIPGYSVLEIVINYIERLEGKEKNATTTQK